MVTNKLVVGVGINDKEFCVKLNGKLIKSYCCWDNMLKRCYGKRIINPTYIGCSVCEEWLSFSNFKTWYDENYIEGMVLDKDILVEGNKVYSPGACRFVPNYVNTLLTNRKTNSNSISLGVIERLTKRQKTKTYTTQCGDGYGKNLNKTFKTILEASAWYSETKKRIVKEQATRAFLDNAIKTDVYLALVRREF